MPTRRKAEGGVFSQKALVSSQATEPELFVGMVQGQLELPASPSIAGTGGLGGQPQSNLPEQLAPGEATYITPADPHERFDGGAFELWGRATDEIAHALEGTVALTLFDGCSGGLFTPVTNESKSHTQCRPFNRTPHVARIEIRQPHGDAVTHGVAAERIDRIEAHGLIIEERDVVLDRVIMPEPRRLVGEQAKCRSVRFGKSELAECDHLAEDSFRRRFGDTAAQRALAKFLPKSREQVM